MKKYTLFLVVLSLFITLLGFNFRSASASNCAAGDLFNTATGRPCGTNAPVPGCSAGDLFSATTGRPCNANNDQNGNDNNGNNGNHYGWCRALSNPGLMLGSRGDAVKVFQQTLKDEGLLSGNVDGIYGPLTEGARQDHFRKCPVVSSNVPVISGVSGPQTLSINQQGTWTVTAYDRNGGNLSYHVDWGEGNSNPNAGASLNSLTQQTSTFTHTYPTTGIRTVTFEVKNSSGQSSQTTLSVNVGEVVVSNISVTSPNGGETWTKGNIKNITWTAPQYFRATYADIKLVPYYQPCTGQVCPMGADASMMYPYRAPYTIATNVSINQNSYSWRVGDVINSYDLNNGVFLPSDGQYTIQICETDTSNCDSSDSYFTITN